MEAQAIRVMPLKKMFSREPASESHRGLVRVP